MIQWCQAAPRVLLKPEQLPDRNGFDSVDTHRLTDCAEMPSWMPPYGAFARLLMSRIAFGGLPLTLSQNAIVTLAYVSSDARMPSTLEYCPWPKTPARPTLPAP